MGLRKLLCIFAVYRFFSNKIEKFDFFLFLRAPAIYVLGHIYNAYIAGLRFVILHMQTDGFQMRRFIYHVYETH